MLSRKIVPPSACSTSPGVSSRSPPRSLACPKKNAGNLSGSWLSASTATKGLALRGLAWWIARAIDSLPVPPSPQMKMLTSLAASRSAWWKRRIIPSYWVGSGWKAAGCARSCRVSFFGSWSIVRCSARCSIAFSSTWSRFCSSTGLVR